MNLMVYLVYEEHPEKTQGRSHRKSFSDKHFEEVVIIPARESFVEALGQAICQGGREGP